MSETSATRKFSCPHCDTVIEIPANLPPTTGPCPKCGEQVTSPALELDSKPSFKPSEQVNPVVAPVDPAASPEPSIEAKGGKLKYLVMGLCALAFLIVAAGVGKVLLSPKKKKTASKLEETQQVLSPQERKENAYRNQGWVVDAQEVLRQFFEAESIEERAKLTIRGSKNEGEMAALNEEFDQELHRTPVEVFGAVALGEEDTKRGIFLMSYNRPEQYAIGSFFRPIPPLRVKYGLEPPDNLLMSEAAPNNFVDESMKVLAFFRGTQEGMKLDWQTYAQTKYRRLDQFVNEPKRGKIGIFRVFVQEDVDLEGRNGRGFSVYRFSDPSHRKDYAKVLVKDESELGKLLAPLKWSDKVVSKAPLRNATVSLKWSDEEEPVLEMGQLICWEFLGLGGERGNWKGE